MSGFVARENHIFDVLDAFKNSSLEFIVVGGYAVSAFQHRFSVDADLVIREDDLDAFVDALEREGFEEIEDRTLPEDGRFLAYRKDVELPITIDLLVNSLQCRQTDGSWSYDYFRKHSETAVIEGSERAIEVTIPERELLIAVKLHSGRLTDARDAVALFTDVDLDALEKHVERGDRERVKDVLKQVDETISGAAFEDAFKGVFSQQRIPEDNINLLRRFIQNWVN